MIIGVPREIKQDEYRVGMIPAGVEELTRARHQVLIERGAGLGSGISDDDYSAPGAHQGCDDGADFVSRIIPTFRNAGATLPSLTRLACRARPALAT